jgi:thiamine biosynthesis lipoprotein
VLLGSLISWLVVSLAPGAEPALQRFTFTEPHMGTRFRLVLYAPDESTGNRAAQAAFRRVAELDGIMSDYRATSEIMQLCKKAGGDPVPVSSELFAVLDRAQEVAQRTDGAFDVTIGPVVRLWRLARRTQRLPPADELAAARALVGWQLVKLDPKKRTVQLTRPGMLLDLGGIGKGYAADEVLAVLRKHNITRALIAAGGDVGVGDPPPGEPGWRVGIAPLDNPDQPPTRFPSSRIMPSPPPAIPSSSPSSTVSATRTSSIPGPALACWAA